MKYKFTFSKTKVLNNFKEMTVILGGLTVKAFVVAPREFKVIGIVQFGIEYGLLAIKPHGQYVRINGSYIEELDIRDIAVAIQKSKSRGRGRPYRESLKTSTECQFKPVPKVSIKRHRTI